MSHAASPAPAIARASRGLAGRVCAPGDKSVSHRALMFGALAVGTTRITGLLEGEDVMATAAALTAMGAAIDRQGDTWVVQGVGLGGLQEPADVLDMGNSGTSTRLLMGVIAGHPITAFLTGDGSLRKRPMARVIDPLSEMGAVFTSRSGGRLPLVVSGAASVRPIVYRSPKASAQIKSAVLLAGLMAPGATTVIEPAASRDHTERMLAHFGAVVETGTSDDGLPMATVQGQPELLAADVAVPGDPSSAAFPVVAGLLCDGSELVVENVGLNPLRTGLFTTLQEMGADITVENARTQGGEPVGDLRVRASTLKAVTVPADRAPSMIDEYPVLAVAAACAQGTTRMCGLEELRVKESDRLTAVFDGLAANGVQVAIEGDDLLVTGAPGAIPGGGTVATHLDHRIAMSFLVLGLVSKEPVTVDDASPITTSFPDFMTMMAGLGAELAIR